MNFQLMLPQSTYNLHIFLINNIEYLRYYLYLNKLVLNRLMSTLTKNEERRAVLRQAIIDNSAKQFIEIWDKQHFVKNYDLSALDVHGDVYTDGMNIKFLFFNIY